MPRSNWKGNISFGLVSIPITLYNSIEPKSHVSFRQINKKTGAPIKYKRVDSETEKEVPWEHIGKGYQYAKDMILPVEENELTRVAGDNARTIAIEEFVDKKNIDFVHVDHTYYLVPDKKAEKGYVILREALEKTNKIGIAKVIISTKEYLAAVSIYEGALVLYLLHYEEEIRKVEDFDIPTADLKKYKVTTTEIEVAKKLINSMAHKWKPEKYKDEFKEVVDKWVEMKLKHLPISKMKSRTPHTKKSTNVVSFVDLLKESLKTKEKGNAKVKTKRIVPVSKKSSHHARARH